MEKIKREDLMSLEDYAKARGEMRDQVMAHKRNRFVALGAHATLYFEDRLTMHYQIQEMLRAERMFEESDIQGELDAYNPLIPDGDNLKATFMLEYADENERREALAKLVGVEDKLWMQVDDYDRVWAVADEDLERQNQEKTSSVHFVRFQFTPEMIAAAKEGATISLGVDHPALKETVEANEQVRQSLVKDFD